MPVRLDKNTLIPIGLAFVLLGGAVSVAYFAGGFFERLSKFDPVRLEVRLSNIETQLSSLKDQFNRIEQKRADLMPYQEINNKPAAPKTESKDADQKDVLRHSQPPVRVLNPLRIDQWGMH